MDGEGVGSFDFRAADLLSCRSFRKPWLQPNGRFRASDVSTMNHDPAQKEME